MFSTKGFYAWAQAKDRPLLFASVETKIPGRAHDRLLAQKKMGFFPALAVLDAAGNVLHRLSDKDFVAIRETVRAAQQYQTLAPKVEAGEKVDPKAWLFARLGLSKITADAAKRERARITLTAAEAAMVDRWIFGIELAELVARRRAQRVSVKDSAAFVYRLYKSGHEPRSGAEHEYFFDSMLLRAAVIHEDRKAFASRYERVRARLKKQRDRLELSTRRSKKASPFVLRILENTKKEITRLEREASKLGL